MFKSLKFLVVAAALALTGTASAGPLGIGSTATAEMIAGWDIDVRPDGMGLPDGEGSVAEGEGLYEAKCASCHGLFGEERVGGRSSPAVRAPSIRFTQKKLSARIGPTRLPCGTTYTGRCPTQRLSR